MAKQATPSPVGNMVIAQSGGPTVVINQSLIGAVLEARKNKKVIRRILGARHGVEGIFGQDFIDLSGQKRSDLLRVARTPASALGSVRRKPSEADCQAICEVLRAHDVRYYFYIGGNDSAESAHIVHEVAIAQGYDLRVFHIPKTIDNDLRGTDHCPGFGSAAKFVAQAFMGDDLDNRALRGVKINVVMGRHAGFLTAAAALGRARPDSGPHLIYLPEAPFSERQFLKDVKGVYKKLGRCVIAVSEGISDSRGKLIASRFLSEVDSHGNAQLSGSGALGDYLAECLKKGLGSETRVRADTLGYMQRSFCGVFSKTDAAEARRVGELAVAAALGGHSSGTISMIRRKGEGYGIDYKVNPLTTVAKVTKEMPRKFFNKAGNNVTSAFLAYAAPLAGDLPEIGFLDGKLVAKKKI